MENMERFFTVSDGALSTTILAQNKPEAAFRFMKEYYDVAKISGDVITLTVTEIEPIAKVGEIV